MSVGPLFVTSGPRAGGQQFSYGGAGHGHSRAQGIRQADPLRQVCWLSADDVGRRQRAAERWQAGQHGHGIHAVRVSTVRVTAVGVGNVVRVHRHDPDFAGPTKTGHRVDDDQCRVALEEVIAEVQATNPVVNQPDRLRQWRLLRSPEVPYHLRTETVVAAEDVAAPGHQYVSAHPGSLRSSPRLTPGTWSGPTPSSLASFSSMSCAGCSSAGDACGPRAVSAGSAPLGSSSRTGPVAPATFAPSLTLSLWSPTSAVSRRPSYGGIARPPVSGLLPPVNGSEPICPPSW